MGVVSKNFSEMDKVFNLSPVVASNAPLCHWNEITGQPGLLHCINQTSGNPVMVMVTPDKILVSYREIYVLPQSFFFCNVDGCRSSVSQTENFSFTVFLQVSLYLTALRFSLTPLLFVTITKSPTHHALLLHFSILFQDDFTHVLSCSRTYLCNLARKCFVSYTEYFNQYRRATQTA